jgi:hypothetical protein
MYIRQRLSRRPVASIGLHSLFQFSNFSLIDGPVNEPDAPVIETKGETELDLRCTPTLTSWWWDICTIPLDLRLRGGIFLL